MSTTPFRHITFAALPDWVAAPGTTITASTEEAGFPASNLKTPRLSEFFRSDDEAASIVIDFGEPRTFDSIGIIDTNAHPEANLSIAISNDPTFATVLYSTPGDNKLLPPGGPTEPFGWTEAGLIVNGYHLLDAPITARYVSINVAYLLATEKAEIAKVVIGPSLAPEANFAWGWKFGLASDLSERELPFGGRDRFELGRYRTLQLSLPDLSEAEAMLDFWPRLDLYLGLTGRCLVIPYPDQPYTTQSVALYGELDGYDGYVGPSLDRYQTNPRFREVLD